MKTNIDARDRLIVALDVDKEAQAMELVGKLDGCVSFFKVGLQLFVGAGFGVVQKLLEHEKDVFLDLKMEDIPETIHRTVANMAHEGVRFFTIGGGGPTAKAARAGRGNNVFPKLLQITALSSWDDGDLHDLTHSEKGPGVNNWALTRAHKIMGAGCDGLIASGESVALIRAEYPKGKAIIVTPGIRPQGSDKNDHKRTLTPAEAINAGSDYLVVGRPIVESGGPLDAAEKIVAEMQEAINDNTQKTGDTSTAG
ncbi:MAG TPA: orotidine-5'-phosphate decarboxylase [Acidiferrobacteraceae bacterium]|nr:orotidine-5'-phosphate decarboxylase [Acidiferrobacteraceae bacterium]